MSGPDAGSSPPVTEPFVSTRSGTPEVVTYRCRSTADGHRCDYRGTRDELATHADEVGHPRCIIDGKALTEHERQTCVECLIRVRDDLDAVAAAFAHLERVLGQAAYRGVLWNALAMYGDGAIRGGGEDDHIRYRDPLPPVAVVEHHERNWREEFGHPRPAYHPLGHADREQPEQIMRSCINYLREWHTLAARTHPGFDDYAYEVRDLRIRVQHAVGMADDPLRAAAVCFDCQGQLLRTYRPPTSAPVEARRGTEREGLTDDWTCRHCGRVYDQTGYFLALRDARDECEGWVPVKLAAMVLRMPESTLFRWAARGEVETMREGNRMLVEWSEVSTLRERRAS